MQAVDLVAQDFNRGFLFPRFSGSPSVVAAKPEFFDNSRVSTG